MGSNEDDSGDRDRDSMRMTPVRGVAVLDAEVQSLERRVHSHDRRLRDIEQWQAALNGVAGTPGVIYAIGKDLTEVSETIAKHHARLSGVEHIFTKVLAVAGACSLVGGVVTSFVLHWLSK
jgi:hypothetical protein